MTKRSSSSAPRKRATSSRRTTGRRKPQPTLWQRLSHDQKLDILGWILAVLAALTILSMVSAQQGVLTRWWIALLQQAFGWGRFVVPLFLGAIGLWLVLRDFGDRMPRPAPEQIIGATLGFFVVLTTLHVAASFSWPEVNIQNLGKSGYGGGLLGALLLGTGRNWLGPAGVIFALIIGWIAVIALVAKLSPAEVTRRIAEWRSHQLNAGVGNESAIDIAQKPLPSELLPSPMALGGNDGASAARGPVVLGGPEPMRTSKGSGASVGTGTPVGPGMQAQASGGLPSSEISITPMAVGTQLWRLPVMTEILKEGSEQNYSEDLIRKQVRIIEETLVSLAAPVRVSEINQGPVVTQYGAEPLFIPGRGGKTTKVKVSKIANLADDLALALSARSIRIQAPIPGKNLVGIEVPNEEAAIVALRDVMDSDSFSQLKGRLRLGLGQDVSGQAVAADLRAMPHLLIAGATGAGKSVCVNSIITALLLQNSPDTLRMILVDPKRVELTQYNGIPHLLAPVVMDVDRVVPTLRWVTREMDSRYRRFASVGARNIDDYNQRIATSGGSLSDAPIPYITVLIDELADVMMQAPDEAERVICRLAQMARATGIHLIIATQRPSVDVVTGLIKANFPARIAFAVASSVDSRVILDMPGAERLLGRGDMLFAPPDVSQPLRLQGAHVSNQEIDTLIRYWQTAVDPATLRRDEQLPQVDFNISEATQPKLFPTFDEPKSSTFQFEDELLPACVEIFLAENRASTSLLQRRLRIGYTRAARLVELLEEMGIIADEMQGQSRKVNRVVAEELLRSINVGEPTAPDDTAPF
ncbi:MAG: DNA translocase FtsK [Anaerolineae bacterium]|jgi:S-DNA-T family DNA segregation ATPase FtsK/SpoIIIE|nr:DNA translocase FtsK [Anaerolineae bacterium]